MSEKEVRDGSELYTLKHQSELERRVRRLESKVKDLFALKPKYNEKEIMQKIHDRVLQFMKARYPRVKINIDEMNKDV